MAEEHITTTTSPDGNTSHTTVVSDSPRDNGGSGWIIGLIAVILLGLGVFYFTGMANSEAAKDNAIAGAARDVGAAAENVGAAAQDAANELKKQ